MKVGKAFESSSYNKLFDDDSMNPMTLAYHCLEQYLVGQLQPNQYMMDFFVAQSLLALISIERDQV